MCVSSQPLTTDEAYHVKRRTVVGIIIFLFLFCRAGRRVVFWPSRCLRAGAASRRRSRDFPGWGSRPHPPKSTFTRRTDTLTVSSGIDEVLGILRDGVCFPCLSWSTLVQPLVRRQKMTCRDNVSGDLVAPHDPAAWAVVLCKISSEFMSKALKDGMLPHFYLQWLWRASCLNYIRLFTSLFIFHWMHSCKSHCRSCPTVEFIQGH